MQLVKTVRLTNSEHYCAFTIAILTNYEHIPIKVAIGIAIKVKVYIANFLYCNRFIVHYKTYA